MQHFVALLCSFGAPALVHAVSQPKLVHCVTQIIFKPPKLLNGQQVNLYVHQLKVHLEVKLEVLEQINAGEHVVDIGQALGLPLNTLRTIQGNAYKIKVCACSVMHHT